VGVEQFLEDITIRPVFTIRFFIATENCYSKREEREEEEIIAERAVNHASSSNYCQPQENFTRFLHLILSINLQLVPSGRSSMTFNNFVTIN
jgi:hypothetical protein